MQRGSRDERGFTMVEMIITIAIMAILAGIIGGFVLVWRLIVAAWYVQLTVWRLIVG